MADRKGSVLIFGLLVTTFIAVISCGFFYSTVNETMMTRRHVDSTRAFWAAEAGLAEGIKNLPATVSGAIPGGVSYRAVTQQIAPYYYKIDSTGTFNYPDGKKLDRNISAVVNTIVLDPSKFQYAIETTVKLLIKGSVDINPEGSQKAYSAINFNDRFSMTKEEVKDFATVIHDVPSASIPAPQMHGVYWVEPPPGSPSNYVCDFNSNLIGDGILIFEGDTHIRGTINFDGIIYVIGKLFMSGTPVCTGAVLAESGVTVDDTTMTGNVTLNYSLEKITEALNLLSLASAKVVSWKEL